MVERRWFTGQPDYEIYGIALASDSEVSVPGRSDRFPTLNGPEGVRACGGWAGNPLCLLCSHQPESLQPLLVKAFPVSVSVAGMSRGDWRR
jgi:hypothetical protein